MPGGRGPLACARSIDKIRAQFRKMERSAPPDGEKTLTVLKKVPQDTVLSITYFKMDDLNVRIKKY